MTDPASHDGSPQPPTGRVSTRERLGTLVAGTYRIARHIGSGGMSDVYAAEHVRLGKLFAVKLLRPDLDTTKRAAQRFRREARAIANLKSEHVVSVVDCGELADATPYVVMELLEGEDLRTLLDRAGPLPVRRAVHLLVDACRGLSEVHAAGLVHRDLKPENLFVSQRTTGEDWCKVLDFGVAKMEASQSTAHGAIVGTVRYMAPEQLADSGSVSAATDVYALGAILYECLAGKPLQTGATVQELMYQVMNREPVALSLLRPELPEALLAVVARSVDKRATNRPGTTAELAHLLAGALAPAARQADATSTVVESDDNQLVTDVGARSDSDRPKRRAWVGPVALVGMLASFLTGSGWATRTRGSPAQVGDVTRTVASSERPPRLGEASLSTAGLAASTAAPAKPETLGVSSAEPPAGLGLMRERAAAKFRPTPVPGAVTAQIPPDRGANTVPVGRFDASNPYGD